MIVTLPNVEKLVSIFLQADADVQALVEQRTYTAIPSNATYPLVRVNQYDEINVTQEPLWVVNAVLQVEAFGGSNTDAVNIARTVQAVLADRLIGVHDDGVVTGVRCSGLRNDPDREFSPWKPRRIFRCQVTAHPRP